MDRIFIPAERIRPIEREGLFGSWDWDFTSGALNWSDGVYRLLGFEPGMVAPSYKLFLEAMHPEDRFGYELNGYDAVLDGRLIDSEFRIVHPDGTVRWVANKGEVFRSDEGKPFRAAGTLIDITARREAELALQAGEERYRALVKVMAVAEWRSTPDGQPLEVTNWSALTGQSGDAYKGAGWMDTIHPGDLERVCAERRKAIEAGHAYEICFRIRHAEGSYRWVLGRAVPLRNPDGTIREWVGMIMDVHDRRAAEERLMISEQRLREALRTGRVVAWEYDPTRDVVARSDNAADVIGVGSEPLEAYWKRLHPGDIERVRAAWRAAVDHGAPYDVEYRYRHPDGRLVWLASRGTFARSLRTLSDRGFGVTFDITAEKEAERDAFARHGGAISEDRHVPLAGEPEAVASTTSRISVTFQPTGLATRTGREAACFVRIRDCVVALLARLEDAAQEEHQNTWFLVVGFGPWDQEALIFETLADVEDWVRARLPATWKPG